MLCTQTKPQLCFSSHNQVSYFPNLRLVSIHVTTRNLLLPTCNETYFNNATQMHEYLAWPTVKSASYQQHTWVVATIRINSTPTTAIRCMRPGHLPAVSLAPHWHQHVKEQTHFPNRQSLTCVSATAIRCMNLWHCRLGCLSPHPWLCHHRPRPLHWWKSLGPLCRPFLLWGSHQGSNSCLLLVHLPPSPARQHR